MEKFHADQQKQFDILIRAASEYTSSFHWPVFDCCPFNFQERSHALVQLVVGIQQSFAGSRQHTLRRRTQPASLAPAMVSHLEHRVLLVAPTIQPTFGNPNDPISMPGYHGETLTYTESSLVNGFDPDGTSVHLELASSPQQGVVTFAYGDVIYTPNDASYVGPDSFSLKYVDEDSEESPAVVVNVILSNSGPLLGVLYSPNPLVHTTGGYHDTPIQQDDSYLMIADHESDPVTLSVVDDPTHGTLQFNTQTGAFTYTPNPLYVGPDSFTFTANDGLTNGASEQTITVQLSISNAAPTLDFDGYYDSIGGDVIRLRIQDLIQNDSDVDEPIIPASFNIAELQNGTTVRRIGDELIILPPQPSHLAPIQQYHLTYTLTDSTGAVGTGTIGVQVFGNSLKDLWLATLNREEAQHIGYKYYAAMGLQSFFATLRANADGLDGSAYIVGSPGGSPTYSPYYNTVTVPSDIALSPSTVIHESVHIVDDNNEWYLSDFVTQPNIDEAERLAWAAEQLFTTPLAALRTFENQVFSGPHSRESVNQKWDIVLLQWWYLYQAEYTSPILGQRLIGSYGWADLFGKFGLSGLGAVAGVYWTDMSIINGQYYNLSNTDASLQHTVNSPLW